MNVLHISTPVSWRGGEQQLAYLAEGLQEKGVEQYFVCAEGGAMLDFCLDQEWTTFPIRTGLLTLLNNAGLIKRICRNYEIDIIHTHDSGAHTLAYVAGLTGNKTPVVVSRKVDFPVGGSFLSRRKYNYKRIAAIICVSKKIAEITGQSIEDKSKLKVVYDGIETSISENRPDLHKEFSIPEYKRIIGNVAALAPHKDYFTWIDTAEILLEKIPDLHFLIIGDGPLRTQIKAYIERKSLQANITLAGFREDAKHLLAGFDIFLNTSKTEGLGSSILDAYVRHVPVVATEAGGVPEIVVDNETGLLAPVGGPHVIAEKVAAVLTDDNLRKRLINNASAYVKNFDKNVIVKKTLEIYEEVVK